MAALVIPIVGCLRCSSDRLLGVLDGFRVLALGLFQEALARVRLLPGAHKAPQLLCRLRPGRLVGAGLKERPRYGSAFGWVLEFPSFRQLLKRCGCNFEGSQIWVLRI